MAERAPGEEAFDLNELGLELLAADDLAGAATLFEAALAVDPKRAAAWYNLALVHKRRRDWLACLRCNVEYRRVTPAPLEGDPAMWNLAIAAVAVNDWSTAREAWTSYGVELPTGDGPVAGSFGLGLVRVDPGGSHEVVWTHRLNPAQARIESVPRPDTARRWHDVLLVDGEPKGEQLVAGSTFVIFDEIAVLEASHVPTLACTAKCRTAADLDDLLARFELAGWGSEDWTPDAPLAPCTACGMSQPHQHRDHRDLSPWVREREIGLATDLRTAVDLLEAWRRERRRARDYVRPTRLA